MGTKLERGFEPPLHARSGIKQLRLFSRYVTHMVKLLPFVEYLITGIDSEGRRFHITTTSAVHAQGINIDKGSKWKVYKGGIKRRI